MATTVKQALQEGELYTDNETYTFIKLPTSQVESATKLIASCSSSSNAFRGLLFDKDEITLMVATCEYEQHHKKIFSDSTNVLQVASVPYKLITFDVVMDPNLIGFMHAITKVLAAEKISVLPFAAYSRDHIFIQQDDFPKAMAALERLKQEESLETLSM